MSILEIHLRRNFTFCIFRRVDIEINIIYFLTVHEQERINEDVTAIYQPIGPPENPPYARRFGQPGNPHRGQLQNRRVNPLNGPPHGQPTNPPGILPIDPLRGRLRNRLDIQRDDQHRGPLRNRHEILLVDPLNGQPRGPPINQREIQPGDPPEVCSIYPYSYPTDLFLSHFQFESVPKFTEQSQRENQPENRLNGQPYRQHVNRLHIQH